MTSDDIWSVLQWSGPIRVRGKKRWFFVWPVWITGLFSWVVQVERTDEGILLILVVNERNRVIYADTCCFDSGESSPSVLLRRSLMSFLSKVTDGKVMKAALEVTADESIVKKWPALYEYLTRTSYPDGSARETATLSVSMADDGWKFCLRDRDNSRCLWITSMSFLEAFKMLDKALQGTDAPWVRDRFSTNGNVVKRGNKK